MKDDVDIICTIRECAYCYSVVCMQKPGHTIETGLMPNSYSCPQFIDRCFISDAIRK